MEEKEKEIEKYKELEVYKNHCFTRSLDLVNQLRESFVLSDTEDDMKIFIPEEYKTGILIRKVNNYLKENHKNSKIVNDLSLANTIVMPDSRLSVNFVHSIELDKDGNVVNYEEHHKYQSGSVKKQSPENKITGVFALNAKGSAFSNAAIYKRDNKLSYTPSKIYCELLLDKKFKFIHTETLKKMSKKQFIKDAVTIENDMNPEKVKMLLSTLEGVDLFHNAMKGKNLTPYFETIIEAFYTATSGNLYSSRTIKDFIIEKILRNYDLAKILKKYYAKWESKLSAYKAVMKEMKLTPNEEFIKKIEFK